MSRQEIEELKAQTKSLEVHASVANEEMAIVKTEIQWIKGSLQSLDIKMWALITGVASILIKLLFK